MTAKPREDPFPVLGILLAILAFLTPPSVPRKAWWETTLFVLWRMGVLGFAVYGALALGGLV